MLNASADDSYMLEDLVSGIAWNSCSPESLLPLAITTAELEFSAEVTNFSCLK